MASNTLGLSNLLDGSFLMRLRIHQVHPSIANVYRSAVGTGRLNESSVILVADDKDLGSCRLALPRGEGIVHVVHLYREDLVAALRPSSRALAARLCEPCAPSAETVKLAVLAHECFAVGSAQRGKILDEPTVCPRWCANRPLGTWIRAAFGDPDPDQIGFLARVFDCRLTDQTIESLRKLGDIDEILDAIFRVSARVGRSPTDSALTLVAARFPDLDPTCAFEATAGAGSALN
jgi:hypothetical protein